MGSSHHDPLSGVGSFGGKTVSPTTQVPEVISRDGFESPRPSVVWGPLGQDSVSHQVSRRQVTGWGMALLVVVIRRKSVRISVWSEITQIPLYRRLKQINKHKINSQEIRGDKTGIR